MAQYVKCATLRNTAHLPSLRYVLILIQKFIYSNLPHSGYVAAREVLIMKILRTRKPYSFLAATLATALLSTPGSVARAQSETVVAIDSTDREALNSPLVVSIASGRFKVVGRSYQVRAISQGEEAGSVAATRPYYIFPLNSARGQAGRVIKATLTFKHPDGSMSGPDDDEALDPTETMTFYPIDRFSTQELRDLREPWVPGTQQPATPTQAQLDDLGLIFDDLGDGPSYGTLTASPADNGTTQTVSLNSSAVRALNQAIANRDADFKIGGDLSSGRRPGEGHARGVQERIFRGADDSGGAGFPEIRLTLTFSDAPAPAPLLGLGLIGPALLGLGLGGLGVASRRRKKRA